MKTSHMLVITALIALPIVANESLTTSNKLLVKTQTPPTSVVQPMCPATSDTSANLDQVGEHDHCPSCKMGVFFARGSDKLSCSYCELEKAQ